MAALPTVAVALAACVLAWDYRGSIASVDWLLFAVVAALLVAVILLSGAAARPARGALVSVTLLLGLAVWATASLAWSPAPALARDEGLLTVFYAAAFLVPLLTLRTPQSRLAALHVLVLVLGAFAVLVGARLAFGGSVLALYEEGRLYFPITYANAQAAFFLAGLWPAVIVAARRAGPVPVRALALGAAAAMFAGSLLAQSKGATVGLVASTLTLFAVSPARLRLLVPTSIVLAAGAAAFLPLTGPFREVDPAATEHAIHRAGWAVLAVTLAGTVLGAAYALLDRRVDVRPRAQRLAGRLAVAALAVAAVAGAAAFVATVDRPSHFLGDQWRSFKHRPRHEATETTHLLQVGSNRYDFWRVALGEFERHPVAGIGARGFKAAYLAHRRSDEAPARAHSLPLEVLAEDGIVGFALLAGAFGTALVVVGRQARRRKAPAIAALAASAGWLAHASVDWIWTFPACGILLFGLLGLAAARDDDGAVAPRVARAGAAGAIAVAALAFAPVWISARLTNRAAAVGPPAAAGELRWARRLDPVSADPLLAEARLAHDAGERIPPLERAAAKEPRNVAIQYFLAATLYNAGRREEGRERLRRALALDPHDPYLAAAARKAGI